MKKGIKIRRARPEDLPNLEPLLQDLIGDPVGDRGTAFKDSLKHEEYVAFVAVDRDEVVGFIDLWVLPDPGHGSPLGYLTNLVVAKARRRGGIGKALVESVVDAAKKQGSAEVHVTTKWDNEPAQNLYNSLGFTKRCAALELEMVPPHGPGPS